MKGSMQIKLLAGILAVLTVIAGLVARNQKPLQDQVVRTDPGLEKKVNKAMAPNGKPYLVP